MFAEERRKGILAYLDKHERASVLLLAKMFGVTKETIRTDLRLLSNQGGLQRCHGGALVIRRGLYRSLISPQASHFDVLLQQMESHKYKRDKKRSNRMSGRVCILGSFNVDIVAKVKRFPRGGESLLAESSSLGPGGKGSNQATAASQAGARVHFVSKVGTDHFSQFACDHLASSAIDSFRLYQSETAPTGNAIIYVSDEDGENMIAINPGANQTITDNEISEMAAQLKESDVLLVQLENNISAILSAIKLAKAMGVTIIMNPAPYSEKVLQCLPYIDLVTPNETEASQLSGIEVTDIDSAKQAALAIVALGVPQVIITLGAQGALLYQQHQFQIIHAFPALCIDSTGAGDAFNGALAAALAAGQSMQQAATYAAAFASLAVELEGASNMPTHQQVASRLSQR